ncbi:hypothetical protein M5E87_10220 [Flavonifractor plautii]|nr:hypothetical protein M5E87_10220 [Flavonifractor plautii]
MELSLNYLSALLMDTANLPMTGYQKYLARLWEAAPVINTVGIRDAKRELVRRERGAAGGAGRRRGGLPGAALQQCI